jgi:LysM repeat protein
MQKRFNCLHTVLILFFLSVQSYAQNKVEYKDVILDGKPAKLNIATGEITLIDKQLVNAPLTTKAIENSTLEESSEISDFHVVKEGESLLDLSRTYKTSLAVLKQANNLETTLISKGQKLRVKNFSLDSSLKVQEENIVERKSNRSIPISHTVKKDETLYSLAKQYNLSIEELKRFNDLNSNTIKVGQKLRITDIARTTIKDNSDIWIVSKDDTLYSISTKTGISVEDLKTLNGLSDNVIQIGQEIKLR